jgi:hypothetical protein
MGGLQLLHREQRGSVSTQGLTLGPGNTGGGPPVAVVTAGQAEPMAVNPSSPVNQLRTANSWSPVLPLLWRGRTHIHSGLASAT